MIRKHSLLFFCLCFFILSRAQKPEQLLSNWSSKSPIEKAYVHFDRENYIAGETAWFKAYMFSDYLPDTISTSLYVELITDSGVVANRVVVPIVSGTANGHFDLHESLMNGTYQIRAFTPTMLNQDAGFIYKRNIFIYGRKKNIVEPSIEKLIRIEFFPEGGNLITGFLNTLAFKVTNEYGLPSGAKGKIVNEKNEVITTFTTYHDGMGMFEMTPVANQKYFAEVDGDLSSKKFYLPEQTDKGVVLTVIPHPQGSFFEIKQRKDDPSMKVAYILGQMQHHIVFKQEFKTDKVEIQGVINTQNLHSGILQITCFNKDDQPLAERLCFVNNKEYLITGELIADTINFSEKGRNRFSVKLKDTVQGSFSISIVDPDYDLLPRREENIFSSLLLTADLKGYIHNPAYYFSDDNDSIKTALDLVMMTNGWRRFNWTELAQRSFKASVFKDDSYITLSGRITLRDSKKLFVEKPLLLMLITPDSTRKIQMINTDKQGLFRLDSMLFFGKSRLFFSDIRGKKSQHIDVHLQADSLARSFLLPFNSLQTFSGSNSQKIVNNSKIDLDYDEIRRSKGLMLEGVTIKAKKKNPIEELEEKYTSGLFSGESNRIIDLTKNKEADSYLNIFDYLQSRIPGLSIVEPNYESSPPGAELTEPPGYRLFYRQAGNASASSLGPTPMTLYLNEVETESNVIQTIPASEIAMVKLFSTFAAASGGGAGGVLAIYTKKGDDLADAIQQSAAMKKYTGYSITKEFYSPNYAVDKSANMQTDNRITLVWRPNIMVNNVNPKIPITFYNNERSKNFKVIVEGMTVDGKMLSIEKILTPVTKGF